jgi:hypothetical protein
MQRSNSGTGSEGARQGAPIPSREAVLHGQINLWLMSVVPLLQFVANTRDLVEEAPTFRPVDGGVKCSVEASLIGLCTRLDKIVSDESNWTLKGYRDMEEQYSNLMRAHSEALQAQRTTSEVLVKPHMTMRPTLLKMDIGGWAAFIGDMGSDSAIIGLGACPAAALAAFDDVFEGRTEPATFVDTDKPIETSNEKTPMDNVRRRKASKPAKQSHSRRPRRNVRND